MKDIKTNSKYELNYNNTDILVCVHYHNAKKTRKRSNKDNLI